VSAATGRIDGLAVVIGMFAGVLGTGLVFGSLQSFYDSTPRGTFTLSDVLHLPEGVVVFAIVAVAIAGFKGAEILERRSPAREIA
jgi:ABC-type transporter Mla maintaining outer membrane lipid asymmetry permease subunit MlaE